MECYCPHLHVECYCPHLHMECYCPHLHVECYCRELPACLLRAGPVGLPACLCPPAYCCCYCLQGTTLNGALGVGVPHLYKDFGAMHKKETAARIKQWEVSV